MRRRWIIRGFFIALVLLCAGGWIGSGIYEVWGGWAHEGRGFACEIDQGVIQLEWGPMLSGGGPQGWAGSVRRAQPAQFWPPADCSNLHIMGFRYERNTGFLFHECDCRDLWVPWWAPLAVSGIALALAWVLTRNRTPARGFPVEVAR